MSISRLSVLLLALLAVTTNPVRARAETVNCTAVTALPAVIDSSGVYCLTGSLITSMTSGTAIDIQASNVVLDLNGFRLDGTSAGQATSAIGIHSGTAENITVRNGIVRGFSVGI